MGGKTKSLRVVEARWRAAWDNRNAKLLALKKAEFDIIKSQTSLLPPGWKFKFDFDKRWKIARRDYEMAEKRLDRNYEAIERVRASGMDGVDDK